MRLLLSAMLVVAACGTTDAATPGGDGGGTPARDAQGESSTTADSGGDVASAADARTDGGVSGRVRVAAGNLSSGTASKWDGGQGIRILQAMAPDVACIQEVNYGTNSAADIRRFVDTAFGPSFVFVRESTVGLPNAVVSRWPLVESGSWTDPSVTNRSFVWARIDVPGDRDLWAVSVHLLTTGASERATETAALATLIQQKVPAAAYVVVAGDFNTDARTEQALVNLGAVVATTAPWPADQQDNQDTNAPRNKPYDWVAASASLTALEAPALIGGGSFAHGLVFDTRVFTPLSAVPPALATDSAASGMQHMAVVREFALP